MKSCDKCGKENPADYNFCMRCGQSLVLSAMATAAGASISASSVPTIAADRSAVTEPSAPKNTSGESPTPVGPSLPLTKCPYCAEEVSVEAKKCKHCGEFIDLSGSANAAFSGRLNELSPYYQTEFQKIRDGGEVYRGKWNWAAFFSGGFWALSKGLWKAGLVAIVGSIFTAGIVGIIYWFIFGARGNYMYYRKIVKRQEPWI
jgi:hypothetical protein